MTHLQGWFVAENRDFSVILREPTWLISVETMGRLGQEVEVLFHAEYSASSPYASRNRNMKYLSSILQVGDCPEEWFLALKDAGFKMTFQDHDFEQLMRGQYLKEGRR